MERGRIAGVSGTSAGIGRATARRFAQAGWDVAALALLTTMAYPAA